MTMTTNCSTEWGDVNAQLDYFANAGLSIDSISAVTTDKLLSISPIKPTSSTSSKETTTWYRLATDELEYPHDDDDDDCEDDLLCSDIVSLSPPRSTPTKSSTEVDKQSQGMKVCIDKVALLAKRSQPQEEVQGIKVCIDKVALFSASRRRSSKAKHQISSSQLQAFKRYKKRKTKRTITKKSSDKGISPTTNDILRGRGRGTNIHEGNKKLRDEARQLRDDYQDEDTSHDEKYLFSLELVKRVKAYGGRFLEKNGNDNLWYEMSEEDTRKKAAQVLREKKWD